MITTRPTIDLWGLSLAFITAKRGTCHRRQVGCVLLDQKGRVLATGYNGVARGEPHCIGQHMCPGALSHSGTNLDNCNAILAEQNALIFCSDPDSVFTCCVTVSPCITCVKMLMNTGCSRIVYGTPYPHPEARNLWLSGDKGDREWTQLGQPEMW